MENPRIAGVFVLLCHRLWRLEARTSLAPASEIQVQAQLVAATQLVMRRQQRLTTRSCRD